MFAPNHPNHCLEFFKETFGPAIAIYASLALNRIGRRRSIGTFASSLTRSNQGPRGGPARYVYEYLLVVARKRGS
jgi:hypothetical protein